MNSGLPRDMSNTFRFATLDYKFTLLDMEGGGLKKVSSHCSISEMDDFDLYKLLDKPRLNIERKRSFSELSVGLGKDYFESMYSPGTRSGLDTPASFARNSFEPHPMVAEAWNALRRSLVHFRDHPVGTIAAYDHASEEVLNYDQVTTTKA